MFDYKDIFDILYDLYTAIKQRLRCRRRLMESNMSAVMDWKK